jgi:PAS domain S-box-containing protein
MTKTKTGGNMAQRTLAGWLNPFPVSLLYALIGMVWVFATILLFAEWYPDPELLSKWELVVSFAGLLLTATFLYFLIRYTEATLRRSQENLQRVNRALKARGECSQVMVRATGEDELMNNICRIIVETEGYPLAWVGFAEHDEEKTIRPVAQWGYENGYLETIKISWGENEHGHGPTGIAIRTGKPNVVQHILNDPRWEPWREKALKFEYASSISLPLRVEGQVFGALVIFAGEPEAFDAQEVNLLAGLAEDLSFGIATLRIRRERERGKNERRLLATIVEQETDGILTFNTDGQVLYVNPAFEMISGYCREDIAGKNIQDFVEKGANQSFFQVMAETLATRQGRVERFINRRNDGTNYDVEVKISPVYGLAIISAYAVVIRDLTNEVRLERQLLQAQKLEAIATLAGGISHDFNNILAAIITNTEMALDQVTEGTDLQEHLSIIMKAGFRARNLVRQILTLSNQGEKERQPVRMGLIAKECLKLLRASLPATMDLSYRPGENLGMVLADPTQIHQVIMNLCTNAADAMREGGSLEIMIDNIDLPANEPAGDPHLPSGAYLRLTVADNGHGMDRRTMERIFDPFFTTKGPGRGTGLGLSVVHGIIKNHQGGITYSSETGKGTTFYVYLPRIEREPEGEGSEELRGAAPVGKERILFLDDEEDIVFSMQRMLEGLGYEVVAGTDSREALEVFRAQPDRFDLVITDQTMPQLTGDKLAREILCLRPGMPILLCTGMGAVGSRALNDDQICALGIREVLRKPLERSELAAAIRRALEKSN